MKVVIYPRVSSKKQVDEGDSIESQISYLTKYCKEKGYEIVEIYTDAGKSASIKDDKIEINIRENKLVCGFNLNQRPAFKKILKDSKDKRFESLVFFKWDRFSRNKIFGELCRIYLERVGIELIPTDDEKSPLIRDIKGALSEEEIRKTKERVRLNMLRKFENGVMVGRSPFGYKLSKKKMMIVDNKKAEIVRDIFQMTLEGKSYKEICDKHKLKPQSYYNIIRNPIYIGMIEFEGEKKKGNHEPIISEGEFERVNQ